MKTISLPWTILACLVSAAFSCGAQTNFASTSSRLAAGPLCLSTAFSNAMLHAAAGLANQVVPPITPGPGDAPGRDRLVGPLDNLPGCTLPPAGLIGWWQAEGNANDVLGQHNGTVYGGVAFVSGQVGYAFSFNGVNGYVEVPDALSLRLTDALTIECWVGRSNLANEDYLINKGGDYTWGALNYGLTLNSSLWGSALTFTFANGYRRSVSIADYNWHHIAVVAISGQTDPSFYVDGVAQPVTGRGGAGTINLYLSHKPLQIGEQVDPDSGWNYYSSATLDEVSLYNTALSGPQIQAIYNAGSAGKCPAPVILTQPQSQRVVVGTDVNVSVQAAGPGNLSYQWYFNGSTLAQGTASVLSLPNVQLADSGTYAVVVSNPDGSATSDNAVLDVYSAACVMPPDGLVGWWAAEGNSYDALCQNNGTPYGGVSYVAGEVGQAFSFDGATGYVEVPDAPALRLSSELTIECWVRRTSANFEDYLCNKGGDYTRGALDYGVTLNSAQYGGKLAFTFAGGYRRSVSIADTSWHHIAVTARQGDANPTFYVDGVVKSLTDSGGAATLNLYPSAEPLHIGAQVDHTSGWCYYSSAVVDELSLYNVALSATQIQAIYEAGAAGKWNIPTDWLINYFGPDYHDHPYAGVTADADGDGVNNLREWLGGTDPNKIQFAVAVDNQYVNSSPVPVRLSVSAGTPASMAMVVDSTNLASAMWSTVSSSPSVDLGATEGWHEVWIGLRGRPETSQQTWHRLRLKLDYTPPLLVITNPNPLVSTVSVPLVQVQGCSSEPLQHLSYDVSNAAGLLTNQDAGVTAQFYDTNTWEFTTNYFECLDVPLTNGLNLITLYATDLAGNTTTGSLSVTLDYSLRANPPVVKLYWPQDGTLIGNSTYTWRGWADDPTATVAAQIVDTDGDTNVFAGVVERDGNFWVENLPLTQSTNFLTLTVTDSAGKVAVTNILVYPSTVGLAIDMPSSDQLWNTYVTVNGAISDSDNYTVWVNGRKADLNGGGTWTATSVYLPEGGTALIQARAIPKSDNQGNGAGGSGGGPASYDSLGNPGSAAAADAEAQGNKPERLYVQMYLQMSSVSDYWHDIYRFLDGTLYEDLVGNGDYCMDYNWIDGTGGGGSQTDSGSLNGYDDGVPVDSSTSWNSQQTWPPSSWPFLVPGTQTASGDYDWPNFDPNIPPPSIYLEHCNISFPVNTIVNNGLLPFGETYLYQDSTENYRFTRVADVDYKLQTGGKGVPGHKDLWNMTAWATQWTPRAVGPKSVTFDSQPIAAQSILIDGMRLGSDGQMWRTYAQRDTRDVTVRVPGVDYFTFNLVPQKHKLRIAANGWPLANDRVVPNAKFCVGQKVNLTSYMTPSIDDQVQNLDVEWSLPNVFVNYMESWPEDAKKYLVDWNLLFQQNTFAWWITGGEKHPRCDWTITFKNGQTAKVATNGRMGMHRPSLVITQNATNLYFKITSPGLTSCTLSLGEVTEPKVGRVDYTVRIASDCYGYAGITQVGDFNFSWPPWSGLSDALDNEEFCYQPSFISRQSDSTGNKTVGLDDGPAQNFIGSPNRVQVSFKDYVRFQPYTPQSGGDNIYVTLGIISWSIHGEASMIGYYDWTLSLVEIHPPGAVDDSSEFPFWLHTVHSSDN